MKKYDVVSLGELLIDFIQAGFSEQENPVLEANPGGAPCNVLAMLSKLGHRTAFIGKVGADGFGKQLEEALKKCQIGTDGLVFDNKIHTTLAIVHTLQGGERDFSFYRNPGADVMLREEELREDIIRDCTIFHFGSLSMTQEPCRSATRRAIEIAEQAGAILSFDPNLREVLWEDMNTAKQQIMYGLEHCSILKISDNELQWLTGEEDYDKGILWIRDKFDIPLILLSMGNDGSRIYYKEFRLEEPVYKVGKVVEKTGAGDTFFGAALSCILEYGWRDYSVEELQELLKFSNAAAGIITTRKGALCVMPEKEEILELMKENGK